jgi:hypothetical protein
MVFGNLGANSGTGVAFTHDPATGERGIYGGYLPTSKAPAIRTTMIWCARCTGGCPRTDRYATSGRARRTTSAAARRLHRALRRDGRVTHHHQAARPTTAQVPARPDRAGALAQERGNPNPAEIQLLNEVRRRHEQNSMLRSRGVRLGLLIPGLVQMQVRAITQAATDQCDRGG